MIQKQQATDEELELMARYGITCEQRTVYFYRGHKYDKLSDAIKYARDGRDQIATTAPMLTE